MRLDRLVRRGRVRRAARRALDRVGSGFFWLGQHLLPLPGERIPGPKAEDVAEFHAQGGEYLLRFDLPIPSDGLVIDAGAFVGDWTVGMVARHRCRVIAYEPVPWLSDLVRRRNYPDDAVRVHQAALGAADGELDFVFAGERTSAVGGAFGDQQVRAPVHDVARIVAEVGHVDALKLNIEGAEFDLLDRLLESGAIERVDHLVIQFHRHVPDAETRRSQITAGLQRTHHGTWSYPWVWEHWSRASAPTAEDAEAQ